MDAGLLDGFTATDYDVQSLLDRLRDCVPAGDFSEPDLPGSWETMREGFPSDQDRWDREQAIEDATTRDPGSEEVLAELAEMREPNFFL